jgi:hypothetical protein
LQFSQTVTHWLYELKLRQQNSLAIGRKGLRRFTAIFSEMINASMPISIEAILTIITATIEELRKNTEKIEYNLHTLLFLTTIISQVGRYFKR